ncbi:MAG: hypothetical protein VKJ24_01740 [Synechococcales bacterium]|nr:hypothetical protein [Synechococcales bacterium]
MLPRLLLLATTAIAAGAIYLSMMPRMNVNLKEETQCRAEGLRGTQVTYEQNCRQSGPRGSGHSTRFTGQRFRGGGPGSGK